MKEGQEVTINLPFTYYIGDKGYYTGKILKTQQDCIDEMKAEIEAGLDSNGIHYTVA